MDPEELKQRLITMGKASVLSTETKAWAIRGRLLGFDLCRSLHAPEDFTGALHARGIAEHDLYDLVCSGKAGLEDYQEYRAATLQIEHVYSRLRVLWGIGPLSAHAIGQVYAIIADWQRALCN